MSYLRTVKRDARVRGVNHRLMIRLPGHVHLKIAVRWWYTSAGHREAFIKVQVWQSHGNPGEQPPK